MPAPIANALGNGVVLVTSTVTGAYASGAEQKIDVALGKPMLESLADIANAFHIRREAMLTANGRYSVKLTDGAAVTYDLALTWAQQGLQEGSSVVLETV